MIITTFANTYEAFTREDQIYDLDWCDVAELLMTFNNGDVKEYIPMFNLWQFTTVEAEEGRIYHDKTKQTWDYIPGTIRRCGGNATGLWGLVLDYDGNKSINDCINDFADIEYVIYTTFNHTPLIEKFRVVIPFTRMMTMKEFSQKLQSLIDTFVGCDAASFSLSQAIHLHSAWNKNYVFTKHNKGIFLDPDYFESVEVTNNVVVGEEGIRTCGVGDNDDFDLAIYKQGLYDALKTCSNVHRGANKTNGGGLTLAALVKSVQGSYAEFQSLCNTVSSSDSCLRDISVQSATWYAVETDTRIKKDTRDKFIAMHGGNQVVFKSVDTRTKEALEKKIRYLKRKEKQLEKQNG